MDGREQGGYGRLRLVVIWGKEDVHAPSEWEEVVLVEVGVQRGL